MHKANESFKFRSPNLREIKVKATFKEYLQTPRILYQCFYIFFPINHVEVHPFDFTDVKMRTPEAKTG